MKQALIKKNNELIGLHPGLRGNCSGLRGNLDDCDLSDEDREKGINISDLVRS